MLHFLLEKIYSGKNNSKLLRMKNLTLKNTHYFFFFFCCELDKLVTKHRHIWPRQPDCDITLNHGVEQVQPQDLQLHIHSPFPPSSHLSLLPPLEAPTGRVEAGSEQEFWPWGSQTLQAVGWRRVCLELSTGHPQAASAWKQRPHKDSQGQPRHLGPPGRCKVPSHLQTWGVNLEHWRPW